MTGRINLYEEISPKAQWISKVTDESDNDWRHNVGVTLLENGRNKKIIIVRVCNLCEGCKHYVHQNCHPQKLSWLFWQGFNFCNRFWNKYFPLKGANNSGNFDVQKNKNCVQVYRNCFVRETLPWWNVCQKCTRENSMFGPEHKQVPQGRVFKHCVDLNTRPHCVLQCMRVRYSLNLKGKRRSQSVWKTELMCVLPGCVFIQQ